MTVSFVGQSAAVKLKAVDGRGFIQTDSGERDYIFDLYAIDAHRALVLNEHEFVWVALERVHVILSDDIPSEAEGPLPAD